MSDKPGCRGAYASKNKNGLSVSNFSIKSRLSMKIIINKTKVLSVQLWKTLGLTKVPITETEESTQVQKLSLKLF